MLETLLLLCAYTDYRYRKIPNIYIVLLCAYAVFFSSVSTLERVEGFVLCLFCMIFILHISNKIKGGDIKFLLSTAGALGLAYFTYALFVTTAISVIYSIIKNKKSIPLAFVFFIGYVSIRILEMFWRYI